jgi:ADP-heptose:LPS heptosyltransferase
MTHVLAARLDNVGDVLLAGPAVRALAASATEVTFLSAPGARAAAGLLPGVDRVVTFAAPWILADPAPVDGPAVDRLVAAVRGLGVDEAVVFTSFHQSALPLALLLRLAGVRRIAAISEDYPGSLLDVRHRVPDDLHEVERALSLAQAAGYRLSAADDDRLRIRLLDTAPDTAPGGPGGRPDQAPLGPLPDGYVVVHPGASVPARTWAPDRFAEAVAVLGAAGRTVVVTGTAAEADLTARVAAGHPGAVDAAGALDLPALGHVLRGAAAVVVGNTGPAHLAAAVGTPVVSVFPPTVPAVRWRPWGVPHVLLGDQRIACAGCRARRCPRPGHPCVDGIDPVAVLRAVEQLTAVGPVMQRRVG